MAADNLPLQFNGARSHIVRLLVVSRRRVVHRAGYRRFIVTGVGLLDSFGV